VLYGYPIAATNENWVHECLCKMLDKIHVSLDAGEQLPAWPDIITEDHRGQLGARTGLRERVENYAAAVRKLSASNRLKVLNCLSQQNQIKDLVSCAADSQVLNDLSKSIRKPVSELFGFAFGLLTDLGIRDRHYHAIYSAASYHVCPFCGCEFFDAPGAPREDLDHYLLKSRYPFAAANLRNLVPMGMKCNQKYKLVEDILRDETGVRRRSFDPYDHREIHVSLDNSEPFGGLDQRIPAWQIDFNPDSEECTTWDNVFKVRERFKRDVLDPSFFQWLGSFAAWFKQRSGIGDPADHQLLNGIHQYVEDLRLMGLTGREFLRAPVFQMIYKQCGEGNQRLMILMKDLVTDTTVAA
jgi:hypothetical protein